MIMEEHVQILADLQSKLYVEKDLIDLNPGVINLREEVVAAKDQLEMAELALAEELEEPERQIQAIEEDIEATKTHIIELWGGETKTIKYEDGRVLSFRTTQSTVIVDGAALLAELLDHFTTNKVVDEYITGFKKTAVRKFISVIPLPPDVVELIAKTTVKLEEL